jgi:VanZ family protein
MRFYDHLRRWGPAVLVMAAIFVLSAQTKETLPELGRWDLYAKKLGHVTGYALLAGAYLWGLTFRPPAVWLAQPPRWQALLGALVLAALYGATDEYHQSFVPGRGATVIDVGIDTLGASLGLALALAWQRLRPGPLATRTPARPDPPRSTR